MKYVHQFLVTRVSLIAIGAMLTVPVPTGADTSLPWLMPLKVGVFPAPGYQNTRMGAGALQYQQRVDTTIQRPNAPLAPGVNNTATGKFAMRFNSMGRDNTASGWYALMNNTTGKYNTAVGSMALLGGINHRLSAVKNINSPFNMPKRTYASCCGTRNTAVGVSALRNNTKGNQNTATGYEALMSNTTGKYNTASGSYTLRKNKSGSQNTASGWWALHSNSRGHSNTGLGAGALRENRAGNKNTGLGYRAGGLNIGGSRNVFIGYEAGFNNDYKTKSDKLVIANGPRTINQLITGDFRALKVDVGGSLHVAVSLTQGSDGRLKKDIKPLTHALDAILQLQGKTYRWKEDTAFANKKDIGLVAQEVEKVFPELVAEDERGYKGIAYSKLTAVLIEAIKEQQQQFTVEITALQKENTQLKTIMAEQMEALLARVAMLEGVSLASN